MVAFEALGQGPKFPFPACHHLSHLLWAAPDLRPAAAAEAVDDSLGQIRVLAEPPGHFLGLLLEFLALFGLPVAFVLIFFLHVGHYLHGLHGAGYVAGFLVQFTGGQQGAAFDRGVGGGLSDAHQRLDGLVELVALCGQIFDARDGQLSGQEWVFQPLHQFRLDIECLHHDPGLGQALGHGRAARGTTAGLVRAGQGVGPDQHGQTNG